MTPVNEPTSEQCTAGAAVDHAEGRRAFACWYPQMGGYAAKAVVIPGEGGCFETYVWHDGEFPFSADPDRTPAHLHHCSAAQFIEFGMNTERFCNPT